MVVVRAAAGRGVPPLVATCPSTGSYTATMMAGGEPVLIADLAHAERRGTFDTMRDAAGSAIVVPLGDGALLGGMARWVKAQCPTTRMIGVCATASPAMERSWRSRRVVSAPCDGTIAAGIAVGTPFEEAVSDLTDLIDDVVLVTDSSLITAIAAAGE